MAFRVIGLIFLCLYVLTSVALAQHQQEEPQPVSSPQKTDPTEGRESAKRSSLSPSERKAQKDLEALRSRPKEFRVLVLGVQIFLGRFGYGTGPYNGQLDEKTRAALGAYQQYVGLPKTGDIDFRTLQQLTQDNQILDQPLPFLPQTTLHFEQWDKVLQVQGTWARQTGLTDDAVQTSRISCFREQKNCIESTAVLLGGTAPVLKVLTHVYTIKKWDEEQLVSAPYDGEPCTISILRMNRKQETVTRFTAYQEGEGICATVKTEDVQFQLLNGPQVYVNLKQLKAKETKRILRVEE